jgi:hypothetical protein
MAIELGKKLTADFMLHTNKERHNSIVELQEIIEQLELDEPEPSVGCLYPLTADLTALTPNVIGFVDGEADPQRLVHTYIKTGSGTDFAAAPVGTQLMATGNPSQPFFDESEFDSEVVLLGAIRVNDMGAWPDASAYKLLFATAGLAQSVLLRIRRAFSPDESIVEVETNLGDSVVWSSGFLDDGVITAVVYMKADTKQVGVVINGTDQGYLEMPVFEDDPVPLIGPSADLFILAQIQDQSQEGTEVETTEWFVTFSKSQMGTGLPEGAIDTCGN